MSRERKEVEVDATTTLRDDDDDDDVRRATCDVHVASSDDPGEITSP